MDCDGNCRSCATSGNCEIKKARLNNRSHIKKVIAVLSGKGGVGKSFVTSSIAVTLAKEGFSVGVLDADITGPSIPRSFGIKEKAVGENSLIYPLKSRIGIKIISSNCLLENDTDPIVWRGPLLGGLIKQFYEDVLWGELDYLIIDMPPGTGDVALMVFQQIPVDDLIIVTSPQDLVNLIVTKALKMAEMMKIHLLGVIENMSYVKCPNCEERIEVFGPSHLEEFARKEHFSILGRLPIIPKNVKLMDEGKIENLSLEELEPIIQKIIIE